MFKLINRKDINREIWDAFVDLSDEAWLWHKFDFQDAIATWPGWTDFSFAVLDDSSYMDIIAIVPLHLITRSLCGIFSWRYLNSSGGPACRNDVGEKQKKKISEYVHIELARSANRHNVLEINVALPPMAPAFRGERCPMVNPLLELECQNTLTQTWVVDLRAGKDILWQQMSELARRKVRKAEKSKIKIRLADKPSDLDIYYHLHCETYNRTGVRPHPKTYFQAIWSNFLADGLARILFAEYEGEIIAATNFAVYKNAALFWTGASSDKGLSTGSNSLLHWTAMQWMLENGIDWYEIGEAFPNIREGKLAGLSYFKRTFGGITFPYYRGRIEIKPKISKLVTFIKEIKK